MWSSKVFLILGCILHSHKVVSIWTCTEDSECTTTTKGSVCYAGDCVCPLGQLVLSGTACADFAPYHTSPCLDDYQCSNLLINFQCRHSENATEGHCFCQPGSHYFSGRCWKSVDFGGSCTRNEECMGALRDPYNLACEAGNCACAEGYYERQRGECRKIGNAVGDGCILDVDCQFTNGICDPTTFRCANSNSPATFADVARNKVTKRSSIASRHGTVCNSGNDCSEQFQCSSLGICMCPRGYYPSSDGGTCLAELGSPVTEDAQCAGFLAEVVDGRCVCPPNVYSEENMRDCVKATRRFTDACVTDQMCHTFGAASRCGAPQKPWDLRSCECIPEYAVWDASRNLCRLFAGIGDNCEVDSDCLAGEMEIECILNSEGQGICTCPEGFSNINGLCLTSGLELGEACQATQECTETEHTVCEDGRCSCGEGYLEVEGICAPTIGSPCLLDSECAIENTVCFNDNTSLTCQCDDSFVQYNATCWPSLTEITSQCSVAAQCTKLLGSASNCTEGECVCNEDHHLRDGYCWEKIGLFGSCTRISQCYLGNITDRVQCRNSLCQCSFDYPYSEELHTCTSTLSSSASITLSSLFTIVIALYYVMFN